MRFSSSQASCSSIKPQILPLLCSLLFIPSVLQKVSQGEMPEGFCKWQLSNVPDPKISGLEQSERMASISTHLRAFLLHFRRVYEQQSDLQPPTDVLLLQLGTVGNRSRSLAIVMDGLYQSLYPNLPNPVGGPTGLPPPQNIFQQKVYGCVVLKTYREFLLNAVRELRKLRGKVCTERMERSTRFL